MAFAVVTGVVVGTLLGFVLALVPGLHVNTLAAFVVGVAPDLRGAHGEAVAVGFVAAFAASAFGTAVAGAFLGTVTDDAVTLLPAHRLREEGRAAEAAQWSAAGALAGLVVATAASAPLAWLLGPPVNGFARLQAAVPLLLLAVAAALVASERRRVPYRRAFAVEPFGPTTVRGRLANAAVLVRERGTVALHDPDDYLAGAPLGVPVVLQGRYVRHTGPWSGVVGKLAALTVFALSGALGVVAFRQGTVSPFGWPGSPLLPLLTGLFGVPPLIAMAARRASKRRAQIVSLPVGPPAPFAADALAGAVPGVAIGVLPGLSAAHAAAAGFALRPRATPERALVVLGAANGAAVGFSVFAFTVLGRPRSGALLAAGSFTAARDWAPFAAVALAAAVLGFVVSRVVARGFAHALPRLPERGLAGVVLAVVATAVFAFTGAFGVAVAAVAACIGTLPVAWGVRRSHGMGVIMVPVLVRLLL